MSIKPSELLPSVHAYLSTRYPKAAKALQKEALLAAPARDAASRHRSGAAARRMMRGRRATTHLHGCDGADVPRVERLVEGDRSDKHPLRARRVRVATEMRGATGRRVTRRGATKASARQGGV